MPRLLRSTSVRLALGYAALFAASSLLLIGFLWWRTAVLLDRRNDAEIATATREIAEQLRDFGVAGAIEAIQARIAAPADPRDIVLLADSELKPLAGNLSAWPSQMAQATGWLRTTIARAGQMHEVRLI